jgi:inosose dehydratase
MASRIPRREFLAGMGVLAAVSAASSIPCNAMFSPDPIYPPIDLSYFAKPISAAPAEIRLGYAAITWGGNDRQAIADIAGLGFHGIQLRANCIAEFGGPVELKKLLEKNELRMVALSSGAVSVDPAKEAAEIARHSANAKFVKDAGGLYLQVTDERPANRPIASADYSRLGRLLTEIGKRTADLGITLGYHNHMGSMGERPEEVDKILQAVDSRYARLELDIAHYFQGGGDPAKAIEEYKDVLLFLHIKDVEHLPASAQSKETYRFVELGRGLVDLPAVFNALNKVNFRGWAIVELDDVPDKTRTPKESAAISKEYLEERLGLRV